MTNEPSALDPRHDGVVATARGPLAGIRVLEFTQIVAGPLAGIQLSDLGAEVVKVEPLAGEARRNSGAIVPNEGKYFQSLNRGKRNLTVDLARPEGQRLIHSLMPGFNVVITNYRSQKLTVSAPFAVLKRQPCIMSGYGRSVAM